MAKSLKAFLKRKGYRDIPLFGIGLDENIPAGHFFVPVKLNGKKALFMLDTGASISVLDKSLAGKYKLEAENNDDMEVNAFSASGLLENIDISAGNKLKIGKVKFKNVPLLLMDLSHLSGSDELEGLTVDGVLGSDILNRGRAVIDYRKFRLFLKPEK